MILAEASRLRHECEVFIRYLSGLRLDPYVLQKYIDAHEKAAAYTPSERFDRFLLGFAARSPVFTKLADSYARLFAPASSLRKKLILLLAILESSPAGRQFLERADSSSRSVIVLKALTRGLLFVLSVLLATIALVPFQLVLRLQTKSVPGGH